MASPLDIQDTHSATWEKLRKHYEERLATLRQQNDAQTLSPAATAALRGQIAEVNYLLSLDKKEPEAPKGPPDDLF